MTKEELRNWIIDRINEHCNEPTKNAMGSENGSSWQEESALIWICDVIAEKIYNNLKDKLNELIEEYNKLLEDYNTGAIPSRARMIEKLRG